jgi:hypothetical protein
MRFRRSTVAIISAFFVLTLAAFLILRRALRLRSRGRAPSSSRPASIRPAPPSRVAAAPLGLGSHFAVPWAGPPGAPSRFRPPAPLLHPRLPRRRQARPHPWRAR